MKSGIVCTMALTLLLAAAVPLQARAEELPPVSPVMEVPHQKAYDEQAGPGIVQEPGIQVEGDIPLTDAEPAEAEATGTELEEAEPASAVPSYTQEDLEVLSHAICGEAQSYPDEEQLYVGSVIINRKNHSAYPNTIKKVVFQRGQYACTWDGNYYRQPTPANYRNAQWLLENGSILPGNVVYQASFKQGSGVFLKTKYHSYCYY